MLIIYWNIPHRFFLFFDLLELPSLSRHSPGMGMSWTSRISASCVGVLVLTNSHLSLRTSGLSVFVRTSVGVFNDLGNVSYTLSLSSCKERVGRWGIPWLIKYIFGRRFKTLPSNLYLFLNATWYYWSN